MAHGVVHDILNSLARDILPEGIEFCLSKPASLLSRPCAVYRRGTAIGGEQYTGEWSQDVGPDGWGVFHFRSGEWYMGQFRAGQLHGHGTYTYRNGDVYVGSFHNDEKDGFGVWMSKRHGRYEGEWHKGYRHGQGSLCTPDGRRYTGGWKNGQREGEGAWEASGRCRFVGRWQCGRSCEGVQFFEDGSVYVGEWKDGKRHGKGSCFFAGDGRRVRNAHVSATDILTTSPNPIYTAPGSTYRGLWVEGRRCGHGKCFYPNGDLYDGEWADSVRHGRGSYCMTTGVHYKGEWTEGIMCGNGVLKGMRGTDDSFEGDFKGNTFHGKGVYRNGDNCWTFTGKWKNGQCVEGHLDFPETTLQGTDPEQLMGTEGDGFFTGEAGLECLMDGPRDVMEDVADPQDIPTQEYLDGYVYEVTDGLEGLGSAKATLFYEIYTQALSTQEKTVIHALSVLSTPFDLETATALVGEGESEQVLVLVRALVEKGLLERWEGKEEKFFLSANARYIASFFCCGEEYIEGLHVYLRRMVNLVISRLGNLRAAISKDDNETAQALRVLLTEELVHVHMSVGYAALRGSMHDLSALLRCGHSIMWQFLSPSSLFHLVSERSLLGSLRRLSDIGARSVLRVLLELACGRFVTGQTELAGHALGEICVRGHERGAQDEECWAIVYAALVRLRLGDPDEAHRLLDKAKVLALELENESLLALVSLGVGETRLSCGLPEQAIDPLVAAVRVKASTCDLATPIRAGSLLGYAYLMTGQLDTAHSTLEEARRRAELVGSLYARAHALLCKGHSQLANNQPLKSLFTFCEAIPLALRFTALPLLGKLRSGMGDAFTHLGLLEEAVGCYQLAADLFVTTDDRAGVSTSTFKLACGLYHLHKRRRAAVLLQECLPLAEEIRDAVLQAHILSFMARIALAQGDFGKAVVTLERAVSVVRDAGNVKEEAHQLHMLGIALHAERRFEPAAEIFEKALSMARSMHDKALQASLLRNLGQSMAKRGNLEGAIAVLKEGVEQTKELDNTALLAPRLNHLGMHYTMMGQHRTAIEVFSACIDSARKVHDHALEAIAIGNNGFAYLELGDTRRAIRCFSRSVSLGRERGYTATVATYRNGLGQAFRSAGDTARALRAFEDALYLAKEVGNIQLEGAVLTNMGHVYVSVGASERAIDCLERAVCVAQELGDSRAEKSRIRLLMHLLSTKPGGTPNVHQVERHFSCRDVEGGMCVDIREVEEGTSTSQIPPEWTPDEHTEECIRCGAQFGIFTRRHHCRNCGGVFCGRCTSHQVPLSHYGFEEPVRICDDCFTRLTT